MKFKEIGGSLENRARKNGRSIDGEWIVENETREYDLNKGINYDDKLDTIEHQKEMEDIIRNIDELDVEEIDKDVEQIIGD